MAKKFKYAKEFEEKIDNKLKKGTGGYAGKGLRADYVELKEGDVTEGIEEKDLDAVVLDMATPWLVIPHAYSSLKGSGVLVSFSPTIDQVVRVVEALGDHEFVGIETVEVLNRFMQVARGKTRPQTVMTGHTGYLTFARKAFKLEESD